MTPGHWNVFLQSTYLGLFLLISLFCIASFRGLSLRMSLGALGELQHSFIFIGRFIFVGHYCPHKCVITFILEYKVFIRGRCVWELLYIFPCGGFLELLSDLKTRILRTIWDINKAYQEYCRRLWCTFDIL